LELYLTLDTSQQRGLGNYGVDLFLFFMSANFINIESVQEAQQTREHNILTIVSDIPENNTKKTPTDPKTENAAMTAENPAVAPCSRRHCRNYYFYTRTK